MRIFRYLSKMDLSKGKQTFIFLVKIIIIRNIFCICFFNRTLKLPLYCVKKVRISFRLFFAIDVSFLWYLRPSVSLTQMFQKLCLQFSQSNFQGTGFSTIYLDLFHVPHQNFCNHSCNGRTYAQCFAIYFPIVTMVHNRKSLKM